MLRKFRRRLYDDYDVIKTKKFLICYELEIAFFTWNQLFCPLRMKHRCLKFITNSFQDKINLKFAILINFQNQNLPKLKCVFLFSIYVYLFEVTWLFNMSQRYTNGFWDVHKCGKFGSFQHYLMFISMLFSKTQAHFKNFFPPKYLGSSVIKNHQNLNFGFSK